MELRFCWPVKVAVTAAPLVVIVTWQVLPVPVQAPLQPPKVLFALAVSVRVT